MTPKQYLSQFQKMDNNINELLDELCQIKTTQLKATTYSDMPKGSTNSAGLETMIEKLMGMEDSINAKIDELVDFKAEASARIDRVQDGLLQSVLRAKYINGKTFEVIAEERNQSVRHVQRLHGEALVKFAKANPDI